MNIALKWLAVAAGAVALGSAAPATPGFAAAVPGPTPATLTVDNTRDVAVIIYVERGDFDTRIGTVAPHSREVLDLPSFVTGRDDVKFVVHPEGEQDLFSPDLAVKQGGNVDLYIPTNDVGFVPRPPAEVIPNPGKGTTTLTVENPRSQAVVVFIEKGDFDTRIGTVPAKGKETFYLDRLIGPEERAVEIFVHPEAGTDLASQEYEISPGAHLVLRVPLH